MNRQASQLPNKIRHANFMQAIFPATICNGQLKLCPPFESIRTPISKDITD
jgi:hypothetical protein